MMRVSAMRRAVAMVVALAIVAMVGWTGGVLDGALTSSSFRWPHVQAILVTDDGTLHLHAADTDAPPDATTTATTAATPEPIESIEPIESTEFVDAQSTRHEPAGRPIARRSSPSSSPASSSDNDADVEPAYLTTLATQVSRSADRFSSRLRATVAYLAFSDGAADDDDDTPPSPVYVLPNPPTAFSFADYDASPSSTSSRLTVSPTSTQDQSSSTTPSTPAQPKAQVQSQAQSQSFVTVLLSSSDVLPYAATISLAVVGNANHRGVVANVGVGGASSPQIITLLLDTGSPGIVLFDSSACALSSSSTSPRRTCYSRVASPSLNYSAGTQWNPSAYSFVFDGYEWLTDTAVLLGSEIVALPARLLGVTETIKLGVASQGTGSSTAPNVAPSGIAVSISLLPAGPSFKDFTSDDAVVAAHVAAEHRYMPTYSQYFSSFADVGGFLGALEQVDMPSALSKLLESTNRFINGNSSVYALDFRLNELHVGGINDSYRSTLLWTDTSRYAPYAGYTHLVMFDLSVCGASIMPRTQYPSGWLAIVDAGSACLALPAELFDALVSWLPVECTQTIGKSPARFCSLLTTADATSLPTMSFTLGNTQRRVYVSLNDLVVASTSTDQPAMCLERLASVYASDNPPSIMIGSRALQSLYVAVARIGTRTYSGVASQLDVAPTNVSCRMRTTCMGMQKSSETTNGCTDPPCSDYFFFQLDHTTARCHLSTQFHLLVAILIGGIIVIEVGLVQIIVACTKRTYNQRLI